MLVLFVALPGVLPQFAVLYAAAAGVRAAGAAAGATGLAGDIERRLAASAQDKAGDRRETLTNRTAAVLTAHTPVPHLVVLLTAGAMAALIGSVVPFLLQTEDNPNGVPEDVFDGMTQAMKEDHHAFFRGFFKDFYNTDAGPIPADLIPFSKWIAWNASPLGTVQCITAFGTTDFRADLAKRAELRACTRGSRGCTRPASPRPSVSSRSRATWSVRPPRVWRR